jgi:hypothetical protein
MVKEAKQESMTTNVTFFKILTHMSSEQNQFYLSPIQQFAKGVRGGFTYNPGGAYKQKTVIAMTKFTVLLSLC